MHTASISAGSPSRDSKTHRMHSLAELFAAKCAEDKGLPFRPLSPEALVLFSSFDWNGDLSAMEATIRHAVIMANGDTIGTDVIRLPHDATKERESTKDDRAPEAALRALLGNTVSDVERDLILMTLKYCRGSRTRTADILGISVRTLRNKLKRYEFHEVVINDREDGNACLRFSEDKSRTDHP